MIIELILNGVYNILTPILGLIKVPSFPDGAMEYIEQFFSYLEVGAGILANYVPFGYVMSLFSVILVVDLFLYGYHIIMWVVNKIPVLDIDR